MTRPPMNPTEARACCVCKHWKPMDGTGEHRGLCAHPDDFPSRLEFQNPKTGERSYGRTITGCYSTCEKWEAV